MRTQAIEVAAPTGLPVMTLRPTVKTRRKVPMDPAVGARDAAGRVDEDHEDAGDQGRGPDGTASDDAAADREDEQEGAEELRHVLEV